MSTPTTWASNGQTAVKSNGDGKPIISIGQMAIRLDPDDAAAILEGLRSYADFARNPDLWMAIHAEDDRVLLERMITHLQAAKPRTPSISWQIRLLEGAQGLYDGSMTEQLDMVNAVIGWARAEATGILRGDW